MYFSSGLLIYILYNCLFVLVGLSCWHVLFPRNKYATPPSSPAKRASGAADDAASRNFAASNTYLRPQ
uniref:Uncharacterized protein n=1 Tax=Plectus sambesii TaxID=2011161 RepID=A0A914VYL7_9BILA